MTDTKKVCGNCSFWHGLVSTKTLAPAIDKDGIMYGGCEQLKKSLPHNASICDKFKLHLERSK